MPSNLGGGDQELGICSQARWSKPPFRDWLAGFRSAMEMRAMQPRVVWECLQIDDWGTSCAVSPARAPEREPKKKKKNERRRVEHVKHVYYPTRKQLLYLASIPNLFFLFVGQLLPITRLPVKQSIIRPPFSVGRPPSLPLSKE